ncbi:hypothetical protein EBZ39_02750 [bacterium]|nr:hypothetical protein [bacterium]
MSIEISSLSALDPVKVEQMVAKLTQYVQERHPEVELTRGVFHDLVLYFNAMLNAAIQENIDRVRQSQSLYAIAANPGLADDTIVDQVLSNFNLTRDTGVRAAGIITILFNLPTTTQIPAGTIFTINNLQFITQQITIAIPPGTTSSATGAKPMIEVGDGTYALNVQVVAVQPGAEGNVKRGATAITNFAINNTLSAFAAADFVGGRSALTNVDYIGKLAGGLTAKTIGSRASYAATIKAQPAFQTVRHISILGCGDVEQQRDQHGLFPISGGGKIDIYIQSHTNAQAVNYTLPATFVRTSAAGSIWQVTVDKNVAPGFYDVARICKVADSANLTKVGYQTVAINRGVNIIGENFVPDIKYAQESTYTRYQTATIQFEDTDTLTAGLVPNTTTAEYNVTLRAMPLIGEISDYMTSRDNRPRGTDVLVKAAVPCFTQIGFQILVDAGDTISDSVIASIKKEIVEAIGAVGFSGQLHASIIDSAAHKYLTGRQVISKIDMFGKILRPDGSYEYVRDANKLIVPNDPERLVTGRTTVFLTGEDDISISVIVAGFLT